MNPWSMQRRRLKKRRKTMRKDESERFDEYEREILALKKRMLQWNIHGATPEQLHAIETELEKMRQRFDGKIVEEYVRLEQMSEKNQKGDDRHANG
jgi:hypothetical protein